MLGRDFLKCDVFLMPMTDCILKLLTLIASHSCDSTVHAHEPSADVTDGRAAPDVPTASGIYCA